MSACNTAPKCFDDQEKLVSAEADDAMQNRAEMKLAVPQNAAQTARLQSNSPVKIQRNQSLYYFPGTVCSRFGARLRELRHERNLTQDRMAVDFGIDRSFISDVERGRKSISLPLLEVIALGMELSLSELLKDL